MKRLIIPLIVILVFASGTIFNGCYSDTYDKLSTFTFQLPILFNSTHYDRKAPDFSYDFTNLHEYKEYKDNKERIKEAMIVSFNYWLDELKIGGEIPAKGYGPYPENDSGDIEYYIDPQRENPQYDIDTIGFDYIRFWLHFARLKPEFRGVIDETQAIDSSYWEFDPNEESYLLGEYKDVAINDYFRKAYHIIKADSEIAAIISEALKNRPAFWIITEYSPAWGQDTLIEPKRHFPYVAGRYDLIIRFKVDL